MTASGPDDRLLKVEFVFYRQYLPGGNWGAIAPLRREAKVSYQVSTTNRPFFSFCCIMEGEEETNDLD